MTRNFGTTPRPGRRRLLVVLGAALVAVVVTMVAVSTLAVDGHNTVNRPRASKAEANPGRARQPAPPAFLPSRRWRPVAPATTVPSDNPVQRQYDQGFERGFTSAGNQYQLAEIEALSLPKPAIRDSWPLLSPTYTPEAWTRAFVDGLLDLNFVRQSRSGLGAWLVAQEAPDLMPGIPVDARLATLYATVLDPAITGGASPIPSTSEWQAYAKAGIRWSAQDLQVQLDPQWQSMIAAGWQPIDLRASVEDVSGVLDITEGSSTATKTFSLEVQLGSAHWHHGYGTVLISAWKEQ